MPPNKNGKNGKKPEPPPYPNGSNGKKTGRPPWVPTKKQIQQVETLAGACTQRQIAEYLGIGTTTFERALERDEALSGAYKKGRAKAIADVAGGLLKKARAGNLTAMIFFLKTQAGWRETQRVEHTGADGNAIEIQQMVEEARRSVMGKLDRIAARRREEDVARRSN